MNTIKKNIRRILFFIKGKPYKIEALHTAIGEKGREHLQKNPLSYSNKVDWYDLISAFLFYYSIYDWEIDYGTIFFTIQ